jgi:6-phosphogluconolactonase (cycloisomerase 2 family)
MSTAKVSAGRTPRFVTVDSSGLYVYAANYESNNISQYTIDTSSAGISGALIPNTTSAKVAADANPIFLITVAK